MSVGAQRRGGLGGRGGFDGRGGLDRRGGLGARSLAAALGLARVLAVRVVVLVAGLNAGLATASGREPAAAVPIVQVPAVLAPGQVPGQGSTARASQIGGVVAPSLSEIPLPGLAARLSALVPAQPLDYFLLAEELGQEPQARDARALARHLYAVGFELARKGGDTRLASSCALGLTELTARSDQRRWLRAIAAIMSPAAQGGTLDGLAPAAGSGGGNASGVKGQGGVNAAQVLTIDNADEGEQQRVALELCTALGLARAGEGRRAAVFLGKPGVRELLRQYEGVLTEGGMADAEATVQGWIDRWPKCRTCDNRRVLRRGDSSRLCSECNGVPGPRLSAEALIVQYRAESLFLRGVHRSWAAQTLADRGEPLRDPEPSLLCERLGVDGSLTVWRNGAWSKP